jgi:ATP synthase protein I
MSFGAFFALSFSLCLRFVSRIAFAALIGYYVDKFFGTFPWGLIVFIMVGGYLGLLTLIKVYKKGPDA